MTVEPVRIDPGQRRAWRVAVAVVAVATMVGLGARVTSPRSGTTAEAGQSATPTPWETALRPTASPLPTRSSSTPRPAPTTPPPFVDREAGYWFDRAWAYERRDGAFARHCSEYLCLESVRVAVADADSGLEVPVSERKVAYVRGKTTAALEKSWLRNVPGGTVHDLAVDGWPGLIALGDGPWVGAWAIVPFNGRLYGFEAHSMFDWRRLLSEFLAGFHFRMPGCWLLPCPAASDSEAADAAIATFDASHARGQWTAISNGLAGAVDGPSFRSWAVQCADACFGELRVALGTTATGPLLNPGDPVTSYASTIGLPETRVHGASLDELEQDWQKQLGRATFERITFAGVPATRVLRGGVQTVLTIWRGYAIAFSSVGMHAFDRRPNGPFDAMEPGFSWIR